MNWTYKTRKTYKPNSYRSLFLFMGDDCRRLIEIPTVLSVTLRTLRQEVYFFVTRSIFIDHL